MVISDRYTCAHHQIVRPIQIQSNQHSQCIHPLKLTTTQNIIVPAEWQHVRVAERNMGSVQHTPLTVKFNNLISINVPVIHHNNPQMISQISLSCCQPIDLLNKFLKQHISCLEILELHTSTTSTKTNAVRGQGIHLSCQVVSPKPSDGTQCWNHPTCGPTRDGWKPR